VAKDKRVEEIEFAMSIEEEEQFENEEMEMSKEEYNLLCRYSY
jgi:hypothetical protein